MYIFHTPKVTDIHKTRQHRQEYWKMLFLPNPAQYDKGMLYRG
ncbi:hypothetical protein OPIT5_00130 (plasmid) [Opitutaceae bacterium TAV5]|nr:hypothetical protein OPIT5_00130 [Opitutaceae bacterium TAV5]